MSSPEVSPSTGASSGTPVPGGAVYLWEELGRQRIRELAPDALVVVPVGAIEQHGPFLPTGTDILLVSEALRRATPLAARAGETILLAPFLRIGASGHHLPFGGTISLSPATLQAVLVDAIGNMRHTGVRRVVIVNGHGGNTASCHAAAATLATQTDLLVAVVDYWEFEGGAVSGAPVPGHAGRWETSLVLATHPDLVNELGLRPPVRGAKEPGRGVYGQAVWLSIDGFTDEPASGSVDEGLRIWSSVEAGLAARLVELGRIMR